MKPPRPTVVRHPPRGGKWLLLVVGVAVVLGLVLARPASMSPDVDATSLSTWVSTLLGEEPAPPQPSRTPTRVTRSDDQRVAPKPKPTQSSAAATTAQSPGVASGPVTTIDVKLSRDFVPTSRGAKEGASASWSGRGFGLSLSPPQGLLREPAFVGEQQLWGEIRLGMAANPLYRLIFDVSDSGDTVVWFDRNQNDDFTDDGPPLVNRGSGRFASTLELPLARILPGFEAVAQENSYVIWLFTNKSLWGRGRFAFYARTAMRGHVLIDGERYLAYVTDTGSNEADFTNDGIRIDVDGDGKATRKEAVRPGAALAVNGKRYRFNVVW